MLLCCSLVGIIMSLVINTCQPLGKIASKLPSAALHQLLLLARHVLFCSYKSPKPSAAHLVLSSTAFNWFSALQADKQYTNLFLFLADFKRLITVVIIFFCHLRNFNRAIPFSSWPKKTVIAWTYISALQICPIWQRHQNNLFGQVTQPSHAQSWRSSVE